MRKITLFFIHWKQEIVQFQFQMNEKYNKNNSEDKGWSKKLPQVCHFKFNQVEIFSRHIPPKTAHFV